MKNSFLSSYLIRGGPSADKAGGDSRADGRVLVGYSLLQGKRPNMEDFHYAAFRSIDRYGHVGLFGVFDGHGGPGAAHFVHTNLFTNLTKSPKFLGPDIPGAIKEAFEKTDEQYLKLDELRNLEDGCTGVTALVMGSRLFVANVGDSRAVLCRSGKAIALTVDHKPNSKEERERIEQAGGMVIWAGTWRVGGVLAVSRSFGDRPLKRYVIPTPDVREEGLTGEDEFMILASDGVWDVISNQDAVDTVREVADPKTAAQRLSNEALQRGSNDNISSIIVRFKFKGGLASSGSGRLRA